MIPSTAYVVILADEAEPGEDMEFASTVLFEDLADARRAKDVFRRQRVDCTIRKITIHPERV